MLWIYLFPAGMDFSVAVLTLFVGLKATWLGAPAFVIGALGATWGLTYFLSSLALSRFAHRKDAVPFMAGSTCMYILLAAGMLIARSVPLLFAITLFCGIVTSFFFVGFQLLMADVSGLPVARAVGVYTVTWSTGLALGFLAEGSLVEMGPIASVLPILASSLFILAGLSVIRRRIGPLSVHDANLHPDAAARPPRARTFVRIGWTGIFIASFLAGGVRFLLPKISVSYYHLAPSVSGHILFLFLILQAVVGIALAFIPGWRHRLAPGFWTHLIAIACCLAGLAMRDAFGLTLAASGLGIYSGLAFFDGVFYALADQPKSARNISINEALVGIGGVIGPIVYGAAVTRQAAPFYIIPALALAAGFVAQITFYRLSPRRAL